MSQGEYYLLDLLGDANDDSLVHVGSYVQGIIDQAWKTKMGVSVAATWPNDATIGLDRSSGKRLSDVLGTEESVLFASPRLRALIERHCPQVPIEYLPIQLLDHRSRLLSDEYVLVNPLGTFDCLDLAASRLTRDPADPSKVVMVSKPVLAARKVASAPPLFRIQEAPWSLVVNYAIAAEAYEAKLTNFFWEKLIPQ